MTQVADDTTTMTLADSHLSNFPAGVPTLSGNGHGWLDQLVKAGMDRFAEVGFPSASDEHWRHSAAALAPLTRTKFAPAERVELARADVDRFGFRDESAVELVFVNGQFAPELSSGAGQLPRGVRVSSFSAALGNEPAAAPLREHLG